MRRQGLVYVCCFIAIGYTYWTGHEATSHINQERARNTAKACAAQNRQNAALVGFIEKSIPPAKRADPAVQKYITRARVTWPQKDCDELVKTQVST